MSKSSYSYITNTATLKSLLQTIFDMEPRTPVHFVTLWDCAHGSCVHLLCPVDIYICWYTCVIHSFLLSTMYSGSTLHGSVRACPIGNKTLFFFVFSFFKFLFKAFLRNYVKKMKTNKAVNKVYNSIKWFKRARTNIPGPWSLNVNSCPLYLGRNYAFEGLM